MEKLKLKVIYNVGRKKINVSDELKEYIKIPNNYYEFVGLKDIPDFILCLDFKYWKSTFPEIITTNKNILSNVFIFDRFKLNDITPLRRLYLGTLSLKNTIDIPFIQGRAEKLINDYKVEFSKNFIYNNNGVIVICPNRHVDGWYKYNKSTLSSNIQIERIIKLIKENSNLKIELRIHPQTTIESINHLLTKYDLKLNVDDIDTLSKRTYCIIADRSSLATKCF